MFEPEHLCEEVNFANKGLLPCLQFGEVMGFVVEGMDVWKDGGIWTSAGSVVEGMAFLEEWQVIRFKVDQTAGTEKGSGNCEPAGAPWSAVWCICGILCDDVFFHCVIVYLDTDFCRESTIE